MHRVALLSLVLAPLALSACKGGRAQLEQLVPDGATGLMSVDAKALLKTELYTTLKTTVGTASEGKATAVLDELRDSCKLDLDQVEVVVVGVDALSQSVMGAVRMPNVGTGEALRCADALVTKQGGKALWTVGEADGKATVTIEGGEVQGWALDDDTLVLSSKNWVSAVQARMKGESKAAIEGNLAEAVAMADRSRHVWIAGEVPGLMTRFLDETPAKGMRRFAGSLHYGDELEITAAAAFADEAAAKALHEQLTPMLEEGKTIAVAQGLPQKAADSLALGVDGAVITGALSVDVGPLLETTTAAFSKYMNRSKTAEARVQVARLFDAVSMAFQEERVSRGSVAVLGEGLPEVAPHQCPSDGNPTGETGPMPPLAIDCSKGPAGRCVPSSGEASGPGEYPVHQWTDHPVWSALGFQMEQPHYFHYNFKWDNDTKGYGACQFTVQAFGDLDGDGVYSTYERAGAADQNGVNGAAGLYIDRELE